MSLSLKVNGFEIPIGTFVIMAIILITKKGVSGFFSNSATLKTTNHENYNIVFKSLQG